MRKGIALFAIGFANILQLGCLFIILKDNDFIISTLLVVLYFVSLVVKSIGSNYMSNELTRPLIEGIGTTYRKIELQNQKILEEIENLKKAQNCP